MAFRAAFKILHGAAQIEDGAPATQLQTRDEAVEPSPAGRGVVENGEQIRPSYSAVVRQAQSSTPSAMHRQAESETAKPTRRVLLRELEAGWQAKERDAKAARQQFFRELEARNDEWKNLKAEIEQSKRSMAEKDGQLRQAHHKIEELERALRVVQSKLHDTNSLLETRTAELQESQTFLTKVDGVSDNEVLQLVERLNSTIYQTCAGVTAAFEADCGKAKGAAVLDDAYQRVSSAGLLSAEVMHALRCFDHRQDSVLVQTALQAATVSYTQQLCNTWDFHTDTPSVLQNVYSRIKASEPPSVAGRWRVIGRKHVKAFLQTEEEREAFLCRSLGLHASNVLLACGVPQTDGEGALHDIILRRFRGALHDIARLTLEFQSVVGEKVVSRDLFAVGAEAGAAFDPERMVDEWSNPRKQPSSAALAGHVLCATQLGLLVEKRGAAGAPHADVVLLKPKVVLSTVLEELLREHLPPGTTSARAGAEMITSEAIGESANSVAALGEGPPGLIYDGSHRV